MIISVASGKGGTGKTLVATSLAFSLEERDKRPPAPQRAYAVESKAICTY